MHTHICIYIYIYRERERERDLHTCRTCAHTRRATSRSARGVCYIIRPVHLLRVFLLKVLESNFPGDSLYNSTDMKIPTP